MKAPIIALSVAVCATFGISPPIVGGPALATTLPQARLATSCPVIRSATAFAPAPPSATHTPDQSMATLEQLRGGVWQAVASAALDSEGNFTFTVPLAGEYRICVQGPSESACRTVPMRAPAPADGISVSASCPAQPGSDTPPALLKVKLTATTLGGICATCGKSVTTSTNNAR